MGKAVIVSSLGDAAYKVRIIKDVDRVDAAKDKCSDGIASAGEAITLAEQAETNARATITAIGEEMDAAIVAAAGNSSDATVLALQKKQNEAADALEAAQHDLAQARLKKLAYEKQLETYADVPGTENRELWCADATDDIAPGTEVGTIEVNQETTTMLVAPGGEAADSILQPGMANDALATYYNWAILPGVQRHRPTYRVGTIKEIDYDADTCIVCLDDARSSAQNLKINPEGTPCEVQKDGPGGFVNFCEENPDHPACTTNGSTQQAYSAELKAMLDEINKSINESNTYAYDSAQYGKLEHWTEMRQYGDSGDCEDFALAKYRACLNAGIPASALKIATGKTPNGTGHAWLEVQTDQGNVALDLNVQAATFSDELPYSNRAVQADGTNWSGKGLLLEDVPVEYMQCNAAAFAEDDRVVVHFRDRDWDKPHVIGFEESPQRCSVCVIYKDGSEYKSVDAIFGKTGISVKPNTVLEDKITGVSGHVNFSRREIEINVTVDDHRTSPSTKYKSKRRVLLYYIPAELKNGVLDYLGDPLSVATDGETYDTRLNFYAVDVVTGAPCLLFSNATPPGIGVCFDSSHEERFSLWSYNFNHDNIFIAASDAIAGGIITNTASTAYAKELYLSISLSGSAILTYENAATLQFSRGQSAGLAVSNDGNVYCQKGTHIYDYGIHKINIFSGADNIEYLFKSTIAGDSVNEDFYAFSTAESKTVGFDISYIITKSSIVIFRLDSPLQIGSSTFTDFKEAVLTYDLVAHPGGNTLLTAVGKWNRYYWYDNTFGFYRYADHDEGKQLHLDEDVTSLQYPVFENNKYGLSTIIHDMKWISPYGGDIATTTQGILIGSNSIKQNEFTFSRDSNWNDNVKNNVGISMSLSDISLGRTGRNIQAIFCVNAHDGSAAVKAITVLRNGTDVTSALAAALGCNPLDIMGIIDVSGIV